MIYDHESQTTHFDSQWLNSIVFNEWFLSVNESSKCKSSSRILTSFMKFIIFFQNCETCAIFIVRLHSLHVWWDFMSTILLAGFTRIWRFFLSVQQNTNKNHHYCYEKYQILSKSAQLVQKELFTSWANFKCFDWILCGLNNWWIPPIDNGCCPKFGKCAVHWISMEIS